MVPIKIQCECGQKYAFDVEPVNGRMPTPVACPVCGADGTLSANESIAKHLSSSAPIAPVAPIVPIVPLMTAAPAAASAPAPAPISPMASVASPTRLSISVHAPAAPAAPKADMRRGLMEPEQAKHEARAKAMWGDSEEQVASFLVVQGFSREEADEMASEVFKERKAAVRANGIRKMLIGFGLIWVPIIAFIVFLSVGYMPLKPMGVAILIGLYGAYMLLRGFLMVIAPKSEKGDVAEQ